MLSKLIEALQIFLKYGDVAYPTHCEHYVLFVCVDANKVSDEDKAKLEQLGFHESEDGFRSYRYGFAPRTFSRQARLVEVQGDQEEYADLIGTNGTLYLEGNNNWYLPANRGDHLSLVVKRKVNVAPDKVRVFTKLGNVFTFRLLTVPTEAVATQNS